MAVPDSGLKDGANKTRRRMEAEKKMKDLARDEAEELLEGPAALLVAEERRKLDDYERTLRGCERTLRDLTNKGWRVTQFKTGSNHKGEATVKVEAEAEAGPEGTVRYGLYMVPGEWNHTIDGLGARDPMPFYRSTPEGVVGSAEQAVRYMRWFREQEDIAEEFDLYQDMCLDRGPDEEPPSPEEVRAEMERLREESRRRRAERRFVYRPNADDTFVVDFEPEPEGE